MKLERIQQVVEDSKKFPKAHIEYSGELPVHPEVTKDSFFGVKAVYNSKVPKLTGCSVVFTY